MELITFIGNGNMAKSVADGLKGSYEMEVVGRDYVRLSSFEENVGQDMYKFLIDDFDIEDKIVLLCVKPNNIEEVGAKLKGRAKVVLSLLAGTSISKIRANIDTKSVVRIMPNLASSVGKSMTTLTGDIEFRDKAKEIMSSIGSVLWLDSEKEIDIATALAGSGPAYLALVAEALADGAVKQGLKREYAMEVMRGLFDGFGTLIQDIHPALLKDSVMSPAGTTAYGYSALEDGGVRASMIDAIERAYGRAKEL